MPSSIAFMNHSQTLCRFSVCHLSTAHLGRYLSECCRLALVWEWPYSPLSHAVNLPLLSITMIIAPSIFAILIFSIGVCQSCAYTIGTSCFWVTRFLIFNIFQLLRSAGVTFIKIGVFCVFSAFLLHHIEYHKWFTKSICVPFSLAYLACSPYFIR